jgi:hypothetical protein
MILVRNQIRDMLDGETGKITSEEKSITFGLRAIRIAFCVQNCILLHWKGADNKVGGNNT